MTEIKNPAASINAEPIPTGDVRFPFGGARIDNPAFDVPVTGRARSLTGEELPPGLMPRPDQR